MLQSCRMLVETQCAVAGVEPTRLDGAGLLDEIWPLLNPGCPEGPPPYRDDWALHTQAAQTDYAFRPGGWSVSGLSPALEGRILSVLTLPAETWPGLMTLPRTVGGSGGLLALPEHSWFTVAGQVFDQERAIGWLKLKKALAFQQRLTLLGDVQVESARIKGEIDAVLDRAFAGNKRIALASGFIACMAPPDLIQELAERARALAGQADVRLYPEALMTLPCWLQSLPLGYDPAHAHYLQRGRRLLSENLADLLPLYGGFAGTRTATQLLLSRRGELVPFDPWDSETAPHMLVTGKTGAGKSFLVSDLILQQLRQGAAVFVLDKGDSYRRLAECLGGRYVRLSADTPICINPFAGPGDAEHQAFRPARVCGDGDRGRPALDPHPRGVRGTGRGDRPAVPRARVRRADALAPCGTAPRAAPMRPTGSGGGCGAGCFPFSPRARTGPSSTGRTPSGRTRR